MVMKPLRKNRTETLIGPPNYLGIAKGNRLPFQTLTNVIDSNIPTKILKEKKTENLKREENNKKN